MFLVLHLEVLKYEDERSEVVIGRVVSYQSVSALWLRTSQTHMVLEAVAAGLWTPWGLIVMQPVPRTHHSLQHTSIFMTTVIYAQPSH